jgi:antitoxin ParD1/3/4
MTRQSISFTTPNDNWLKFQVESEKYASKSEVVNELIRKARAEQTEIDIIRAKLIKSQGSGFVNQTREENSG